MQDNFDEAYKKLNKEQKEAVDSIDGPVMVVAGPGTGKTQVLALRIANILKNTDTGANSILCLTFTRSGVSTMKDRLEKYIGSDARNVVVNTFHSFASSIVEKYYEVLDFSYPPKYVEDSELVFLIDEILHNNDWDYIKTRGNSAQYFNDLKSLISLLKKERLTPEIFLDFINQEIESLKKDPDSISSRGESKGEIKKEVVKKIESLQRTIEVVKFYEIYESLKKERGLMDHDDVLEYAVKIVEISDDSRDDIREEYQYILIDEHQDSSFIQNNFLKAVWGDTEMPNIFVVGDDRQLIYGFSGASINYFEEFAHFFGKAKLITLSENYRSTGDILNLADDLLKSNLAQDKLKTNTKINNKINLFEYNYSRDEILHIGNTIAEKIDQGEKMEDFAILLPKNKHVLQACQILNDMGIPTVSEKNVSIFDLNETDSIVRVLKIINNPNDNVALCESILDSTSEVDTFEAHKFIKSFKKPEIITLEDIICKKDDKNLFSDTNINTIPIWGNFLKNKIINLSNERISKIVSVVGNELLIEKSKNHEELLKNVEVVRSFIHMAVLYEEKHSKATLADFLQYFERLNEYNTHINIATIGLNSGVHVMTLHRSKGLEYKYVFIAHMNEEILMSSKKNAFTMPEKVKEMQAKKDIETAKRELYVAITRSKEYCAISYSKMDLSGRELNLAQIIADLSKDHFILKNSIETESEIIKNGIKNFALKPNINIENPTLHDVKNFVKEKFMETNVTVSLLNNFFECSWRWYFRNFLKLPEVKSKSLALGSVVHSTIEFILKDMKLPNDTDIENKIILELEKEGVKNAVELKKLAKDAYEAVKNWLDNGYKNLSKDYQSERNISFKDKKFPNLNMYGKIDLTERLPNGDIVITDFKTGSSKTAGVIEKLDSESRLSSLLRQLAMYAYLVNGAEKGKTVSELRLLFLEENPKEKNYLYKTFITNEQINLLVSDIQDYQDELLTGIWAERPCYFKSYGGSNSECEYCKLANKIFGE